MEYFTFLEKDDRVKMQILLKLDHSRARRVSIKRLLDDLGLTRYRLNKLLNSLIEDLNQFKETSCRLVFEDNELVGDNLSFSLLQAIQLKYLKRSLRFQIFQYEYVDRQGETRQQFLKEHYLSQSRYYAIRAEMDPILNDNQQPTKSPVLNVHPELRKRVQLTNIYAHFFNGIENPFPDINTETAKFCNFITMTFKLSLTPGQQLKLRMFFQIQYKRLQGRHFVNIRHLAKLQPDSRLPFLKNYYLKNVPHAESADIDSEVGFLLLFMASEEIVQHAPVKVANTFEKQFVNATQQFERVLANTPVLSQDQFSEQLRHQIALHLAKMSNSFLVFDFNQMYKVKSRDGQHLTRNFPGLTLLAKDLVRTATAIFKLNLANGCQTDLTNFYLRVLIDSIPSRLMQDKVTICVDFVQNEIPKDYFSQMIRVNLGGGIVFADHLSSNVDIYLSDIFVAGIRDIPQVTWSDPLQMSNWDNLRKKIVQVKLEKVAKVVAVS
ncbi:hypothetical protein [Secundilactobacillus folii]|uniref:Mga helix-turn-helix domain-containing protein n=1 Tax=Secundilactobacillus folii TaxID=2678357 RepID=A0A7X3C2F3_9LACO|nr:hypothetical protein [Secundilactobacillus folii]MTV81747.1 hypothetical protein [Secundilactobacillus folii]